MSVSVFFFGEGPVVGMCNFCVCVVALVPYFYRYLIGMDFYHCFMILCWPLSLIGCGCACCVGEWFKRVCFGGFLLHRWGLLWFCMKLYFVFYSL